METSIQILIVDDSEPFRIGVRALMNATADMQLIGEAVNGREAISLAEQLQPDVILMDLHMPDVNGIEATSQILHTSPHIAVLVLTMVDDDASVLEVSARMLKSAGFRVITASDGHDALHAFSDSPSQIDCVVLDLTMPGMGGEDAFEELRRLGCDAPVILGSGYFHADLTSQFEGKGFAAVLQKPYRRDHLVATVATAIDGDS